MYTVFVNAIHDDGKVERLWEKSFDSLASAHTRGEREVKEIICCDPDSQSVRLYQAVFPYSFGNYSRFFSSIRNIEEVVF